VGGVDLFRRPTPTMLVGRRRRPTFQIGAFFPCGTKDGARDLFFREVAALFADHFFDFAFFLRLVFAAFFF